MRVVRITSVAASQQYSAIHEQRGGVVGAAEHQVCRAPKGVRAGIINFVSVDSPQNVAKTTCDQDCSVSEQGCGVIRPWSTHPFNRSKCSGSGIVKFCFGEVSPILKVASS